MAKQRTGEGRAAASRRPRCALSRASWRARSRASNRAGGEEGFTLIELVIATAIMPLVFGAIAVGFFAVFTNTNATSAELTDQTDAQVIAANFQNDVQSAAQITTAAGPTSPAACVPAGGSQTQVLGLVLGNQSEITYAIGPVTSTNTYDLYRNVCNAPSNAAPNVPDQSHVVARDMPSLTVQPHPVTVTCGTGASACTVSGGTPAYQLGWASAVGLTGVTFAVTEPGSSYAYTLTGVPVTSASSNQLAQVVTSSSSCGFALPTTGTYASSLCFVDFSSWNNFATAPANQKCTPAGGAANSGLSMASDIANTPFILSFCIGVSATQNGSAITGATSAGAACGVAARSGWNDVTAVPLPTYSCPPGSEAFLGNNGFYTGVPGDPGLYTVDEGSTATVTISNIALQTSAGVPATNWELVTGDAESTDQGESITWTSNQALQLLANSTNSPVGNACDSTAPGYNATYLTGLGSTTVECSSPVSADHTGTVMLEAGGPNGEPTSLTMTLVGTGLQATFLGVLLS